MTATFPELETSYFNAGHHGHWTVCEAGGGDTVASIEIDDFDKAEQAANLFAAAPDMLAALTAIRDMRDSHTEDGGSGAHLPGNYDCFDDWASDVADEAIRKATAR